MTEGTEVRVKGQKKNGVISSLIGDIAIVSFGERKEKVNLDDLIEVVPYVTLKEIADTHDNLLTDDYVRDYFTVELEDREVEQFKTIISLYMIDLLNELFKGQI